MALSVLRRAKEVVVEGKEGGPGPPRNCALLLCLSFPWSFGLVLFFWLFSFFCFFFLFLCLVLVFSLGEDGEKRDGVPHSCARTPAGFAGRGQK